VSPIGSDCEFAIAVDDAWQGRGLAGILMSALIDAARAAGLARMDGDVLAANHRMLRFVRQLGFHLRHNPDDPQVVRAERAL
jgi:acetyltransferase